MRRDCLYGIIIIRKQRLALFFNQQLLEEQAGTDNNKLLALLSHHYNGKTIPSKWDKYPPSRVPLVGHSFLLHPRQFLEDKTTDIIYKVQYLKLAAKRDYLLYKMYKYKALQTSFYPDLNHSAIKYNPLLEITPIELLFKYER